MKMKMREHSLMDGICRGISKDAQKPVIDGIVRGIAKDARPSRPMEKVSASATGIPKSAFGAGMTPDFKMGK
jgi:hypothetical protein